MPATSERIVVVNRPRFAVEGQAESGLTADLISLEAQADEAGLSTLEARFLNWTGSAYRYFDGQPLQLGRNLRVVAGDEDNEAVIFTGAITALVAQFPGAEPPHILLRAEDAGQVLRMGQRTRVFEQMSDSEIAARIAGDRGMQAGGEIAGPTHTQLWQVNQSDLGLLRQRARAVDARIVVADQALNFEPRRGAEAGTPIQLTRLRELLSFEACADLAHQRTEVQVHGWSVADKAAIHVSAGESEVGAESSGGRTGPQVLDALGWSAVEHHHLDVPSTEAEARSLATALARRRARRFLTGRGKTSGTPALRVGCQVDLLDLGPWFSGVWDVVAVRHSFDERSGLRTWFVCERVDLGGSP